MSVITSEKMADAQRLAESCRVVFDLERLRANIESGLTGGVNMSPPTKSTTGWKPSVSSPCRRTASPGSAAEKPCAISARGKSSVSRESNKSGRSFTNRTN